jgi:signal transduction histidine kinase
LHADKANADAPALRVADPAHVAGNGFIAPTLDPSLAFIAASRESFAMWSSVFAVAGPLAALGAGAMWWRERRRSSARLRQAERDATLAHAELRAAHAKFAAFMTNFPYPAFMQDERGEFVYVNAAGAVDASWRGAAARASPVNAIAETIARAADDRHWFCIRFPLCVDGRTWLGGIAIDISERTRTERALAERTAEFETLFRNVPAPLWIARNARGSDVVGNAAADALVMRDAATRPDGAGWQFMRDGVPLSAEATPMIVAMRERRVVQGTDLELAQADGERCHVRVSAAPLFDGKGRVRGAVAAGLDITRLKTYEAELERAVRRRDEFLAVLAHELRNPLAPIHNSVQILARVPNDVERVRRATVTIERHTQLIVRLIDELLDVARISQGLVELHVAPHAVREIVAGALEAVQASAETSGHLLVVEHAAPAAQVVVDALRAEQIVVNVLSNALKYSLPRSRVRVRTWVDGERARIAVTDEGQGIPSEDMAEIFTMFARPGSEAKRRIGGMGVGLALAKQLCEQQNGSIEAASEGRGRGATFTISFPLVRAAAGQAA